MTNPVDVREKLVQIDELCELAGLDLRTLKDQLDKIIGFKEKSQEKLSSDDMTVRPVGDFSKSIKNLQEIAEKLLASIDGNVRLHDSVESSLRFGHVANKAIEVTNKLKGILDDLLATGDWETSLFLKTSAGKIKALQDKVEGLLGGGKDLEVKQAITSDIDKEPEAGYVRAFILLYQVDGANLQGWYRTIKNLEEYNVTRPAYQDEAYAKEFIRSKIANIDRNGYVIVDVKESAIYEANAPDTFGHKLFSLKENAIDLKNVIEFTHANKNRYVLSGDGLVFFE